jgi:GntR family transcriptional regulator/MocR family aminotransferase
MRRDRHNEKCQFRDFHVVQSHASPPFLRPPDETGRRIYELLRAQMADGTLPAGAKLPSTRALAAELAVSRTTVTAAYEQLAAEGFIATSAGRAATVAAMVATVARGAAAPRAGSRRAGAPLVSAFAQRLLRAELPALATGDAVPIDFRYGALASRDFPTLAWRREYQAELLRQRQGLYYIEPEGDASLRQALQGYLRRARGISCDAGQIVIVHGSQQAIDLCARLLLNADDAFVFEEPGYLMARLCFDATGATLLATPADEHGLDTTGLPDSDRVRLAYVTPSHQFPLGGVLPMGRRQQLLQWARRHSAWVIEDDYDGEFRYGQRPIDALQALDGDGRVLYIGTFSKALSPQMRLGYLVLPAELVPVFQRAKRMTDRHAPVWDQRVLASLIASGAYERHVRRMRRAHERRRATLLDAVSRHLPAGCHVAGAAAGLHVVLWLPSLRPGDEAALAAATRAQGVGVYPVSPLYAAPAAGDRPAGLVLGYASLALEQIEQGIRVLAECLKAASKVAPKAAPRARRQ